MRPNTVSDSYFHKLFVCCLKRASNGSVVFGFLTLKQHWCPTFLPQNENDLGTPLLSICKTGLSARAKDAARNVLLTHHSRIGDARITNIFNTTFINNNKSFNRR